MNESWRWMQWMQGCDWVSMMVFLVLQCKWSRKGFIRTRWALADWWVHLCPKPDQSGLTERVHVCSHCYWLITSYKVMYINMSVRRRGQNGYFGWINSIRNRHGAHIQKKVKQWWSKQDHFICFISQLCSPQLYSLTLDK